jgi:hypothetical protein
MRGGALRHGSELGKTATSLHVRGMTIDEDDQRGCTPWCHAEKLSRADSLIDMQPYHVADTQLAYRQKPQRAEQQHAERAQHQAGDEQPLLRQRSPTGVAPGPGTDGQAARAAHAMQSLGPRQRITALRRPDRRRVTCFC